MILDPRIATVMHRLAVLMNHRMVMSYDTTTDTLCVDDDVLWPRLTAFLDEVEAEGKDAAGVVVVMAWDIMLSRYPYLMTS